MSRSRNFISNSVSRRSLLKGVGATALSSVGLTGRSLSASGSGVSQSERPRSTNTHVSLAAYSVRRALTSGEMDLFRFVDWCAEMGLAGAEPTSYYFEEGFDSAYLRRLRNRAYRNGVAISGTAIRNNFCLPPGPEKNGQIALVKHWIDYAADLFAPHVRIFAGDVPEGAALESAIQWTADGVLRVLDHAARRGVIVGLENHGGVTARAADLLAICEKVGKHPWFGVNLDTGNYHVDPYEEIAMTAPWAVNVQVKVEIREGDAEVPADFGRIQKILVESGYRGWVVLEYEASGDPFQEIPGYLRQLRELFES